MPKKVIVDGKAYIVPDDATPGEIDEISRGNARQAPAPPPAPGFFKSAFDASGLSSIGNIIAHPVKSAANVIDLASDAVHGRPANDANPIVQAVQGIAHQTGGNVKAAYHDARAGNPAGVVSHGVSAIPILGPTIDRAVEQAPASTGNYLHDLKGVVTSPGTMGTLVGGAAAMAPIAAGGIAKIGTDSLPVGVEGPLNASAGSRTITSAASKVPSAIADPINAIPGAIKAIPRTLINAPRRILAGDITAPSLLGGVSPLARYQAAKNLGVQLDAADATNSGPLRIVKNFNEHSLLGSGTYDAARLARANALSAAGNDFAESMSPLADPDSQGAAIRAGLKANQTGLQTTAREGFESLPQDIPLPGLEDVGKQAQAMAAKYADYQGQFPSLKPSKAMSVVGDVGGLGPTPNVPAPMSPFVDASGAPIPSSTLPTPKLPQSFSTAQQLRSDLLEFGRKNPDIVAGQGDALIRQLAGGVDDAMTGGSSALTPDQLGTFRDANAKYADMKNSFDNPQSGMYYHAVRTPDTAVARLATGVGPKTAAGAADLTGRIGPDATGALQRGTFESLVKPDSLGGDNYSRFGTQLQKLPAPYRDNLFTPDQSGTINDINLTSNAMGRDLNPSGSGKLLQKVGEADKLIGGSSIPLALTGHPVAAAAAFAEPLAQYPVAKMMNSPAITDWLMRPPTIAPPTPVPTGIPYPLTVLPAIRPQNQQ